MSFALPSATKRPPTFPVTPFPVTDAKLDPRAHGRPVSYRGLEPRAAGTDQVVTRVGFTATPMLGRLLRRFVCDVEFGQLGPARQRLDGGRVQVARGEIHAGERPGVRQGGVTRHTSSNRSVQSKPAIVRRLVMTSRTVALAMPCLCSSSRTTASTVVPCASRHRSSQASAGWSWDRGRIAGARAGPRMNRSPSCVPANRPANLRRRCRNSALVPPVHLPTAVPPRRPRPFRRCAADSRSARSAR